jgi:ubiquinone/menaquinone biosynthesis C-methylase UbiE
MSEPVSAVKSDPRVLPTREGYDLWAEVYDVDGNPLIALEEPRVQELLGPVSGLRVLDVGCGTGRHALRLAREGAKVEALDFSTGMLTRAREKAGALPIHFQLHDLATPLPFADDTFERVLCSLLLDHICDLDDLFSEMHRVCGAAGCLVVSVMHPAMMLRGVQARFHDPITGSEIRPESQAHTISEYVMAASRAGFRFDYVAEFSVGEELADRFERARRYLGWPMLFLMRLLPENGPGMR